MLFWALAKAKAECKGKWRMHAIDSPVTQNARGQRQSQRAKTKGRRQRQSQRQRQKAEGKGREPKADA